MANGESGKGLIPALAAPFGLVFAVWLAVAGALSGKHRELLTWDEVDYVNAAKLGCWSNLMERGSLAPLGLLFIRDVQAPWPLPGSALRL